MAEHPYRRVALVVVCTIAFSLYSSFAQNGEGSLYLHKDRLEEQAPGW